MINIKVLQLVKPKSAVANVNGRTDEGRAFMDYESGKCKTVQRGSICGNWEDLPCLKIFQMNNESNNNNGSSGIQEWSAQRQAGV